MLFLQRWLSLGMLLLQVLVLLFLQFTLHYLILFPTFFSICFCYFLWFALMICLEVNVNLHFPTAWLLMSPFVLLNTVNLHIHNCCHSLVCSVYSMGQATPVNGATTAGVSKPQPASTVSSVPATQSGKDYDFSSLTQGMFAKP
jgi:hypothetical protein